MPEPERIMLPEGTIMPGKQAPDHVLRHLSDIKREEELKKRELRKKRKFERKLEKLERKKEKAVWSPVDSFVISDLSDPKKLELFYEAYGEDYRTTRKTTLTGKVRGKAQELVNTHAGGILQEKKQIFVATTKIFRQGRFREVPADYVVFWVAPSGLKYYCDRIYTMERFRGVKYGGRMVLRSLGRAFLEHPLLEFACYKDAVAYDTKPLLEDMQKRGFFKRIDREDRDLEVFLDHSVLVKEAEVIRTFERWKATPRRRLLERHARWMKLQALRRQNIEAWGGKKPENAVARIRRIAARARRPK